MATAHAIFCLVFLAVIYSTDSTSIALKREWERSYPLSSCPTENYLCRNERCIQRSWFCDGSDDCGDNSDEEYCELDNYRYLQYPSHYPFMRCGNKHIPEVWKCDGINDCSDATDELGCNDQIMSVSGGTNAMARAEQWLISQANLQSPKNKWGINVPRMAVALYFASSKYFARNDATGQTITYEVSLRLLEALVREQMDFDTLSANELALYINALTVSCSDARDFNGMDLVERLNRQVKDATGYTSPFVLLSLCNAGQELSAEQIDKLYTLYNEESTRIDKLAFALMALSCVADKDASRVPSSSLTPLASKLEQRQHEDGRFENIPTTALALQALIASGEAGGDNFAEGVKYLIESQSSNGSFGNLLNTYYVVPVLQYKSLLDLDSMHCDLEQSKKAIGDFKGVFKGQRVLVTYSIGVGDEFDFIHLVTLRVPANSTFFEVMQIASTVDDKFRFEYVSRNAKPFVYELNGIQDDAELEKYWLLYNGTQSSATPIRPIATPIHSSPADVVIHEDGSFMMWYRSLPLWTDDHNLTYFTSTLPTLE